MNVKSIPLIALVVLVCSPAAALQADVLFDNGPFSGPQSNTRNTAETGFSQRLFDDFTLVNDSEITGFEWLQHDRNDLEYLNTEITANSWRVRNAGNSFTSALEMLDYNECDAVKSAVEAALGGDDQFMDGEVFTNAMTKLGHAVATHLKGVRENQANMGWDYNTHRYIMGEIKPVTRADFRKSMESHLISLLNLRTGSARVDIGQFPASIPRKWWC